MDDKSRSGFEKAFFARFIVIYEEELFKAGAKWPIGQRSVYDAALAEVEQLKKSGLPPKWGRERARAGY